jgi:anthranilate phosphoribosyltransferase
VTYRRVWPVRSGTVANAAAAPVAYGKLLGGAGERLRDELERARQAIDSGAAQSKLQEWIAVTQSLR